MFLSFKMIWFSHETIEKSRTFNYSEKRKRANKKVSGTRGANPQVIFAIIVEDRVFQ